VGPRKALLKGSSSVERNPPLVSVEALKSWSTKCRNLRAGRMCVSAGALRASRTVEGEVVAS